MDRLNENLHIVNIIMALIVGVDRFDVIHYSNMIMSMVMSLVRCQYTVIKSALELSVLSLPYLEDWHSQCHGAECGHQEDVTRGGSHICFIESVNTGSR
jgi:hypothetical protein